MRTHSLLLSCAGLLAATAASQDPQIVVLRGTIPPSPASAHAPTAADVPAPPRTALDQAPPKHGVPAIPVVDGPELPPGPPTEPRLPGAAPLAGGITVYRNTPVVVGSRSNVGEPACAHNGSAGIQTGNWYAATTNNDGQSWSYVNPYTRFAASDGGFCCDQYTLQVNHIGTGTIFWLLQYGYSASSQTNRLRIAVMRGSAAGSNTVHCSYELVPSNAGFAAGTWFDFPHMGASNGHLYVAANVFNASNAYQGAAVMRLNLANMNGCQNAAFGAYRSTSMGSFRFAQQAGPFPEMFFAAHATTSSLAVFRWNDADGQPTVTNVPISQWYSGTTPVLGPDGTSFTNRSDNRLQGAYDNSVHVGFMWYSNQGGAYPLPHVRAVWLDRATRTVAGERAIWSSQVAWAYPSAAPTMFGHIGGSIAYGGGTWHPGTAVWVVDDTNCWGGWDNLVVAGGTHGPSDHKWGDYYTTQADTLQQTTWLTTAMSLNGGGSGSDMVPRNVDFGRSNAFINFGYLNVRSIGAAGASITIDRTDNFCRGGQAADFARVYRADTVVQVSAPASAGGRNFYRWRINGDDQPVGLATASVTVSGNASADAVYGSFTPGVVAPFGTGCRGSASPLSLATPGVPEVGRASEFRLAGAPPFFIASVFVGVSRTTWAGIPLPLVLPPGPCTVYTDMTISVPGATNLNGTFTTQIGIPLSMSLIGGTFYTQALCIDSLAPNPFRITTTNALDCRIGGWQF